jgi:hypothetical protein
MLKTYIIKLSGMSGGQDLSLWNSEKGFFYAKLIDNE